MKNKTDIELVKAYTKALLNSVPVKSDEKFEFIVRHPFTQSPFSVTFDGEMIDLRTKDGYKKWIDMMEILIDEQELRGLFEMVNNPWNLTWLKFVKEYLSIEDFSGLLRESWVTEENPNQDVNVSRRIAIKWFKEADKKILMTEEDYAYWEALPDEVILYRGVSKGREKYGLSWTDRKETAIWFRDRWFTEEDKGQLLKVIAKKEHCLCYFNTRGEEEIVLDVNAVKNDIEDITDMKL